MLLKVCPLLADCFSLVTARSVLCLAAAIRASGYYGLRFPVDPGVRAAQQQNQQHWIVFLSRVFRRRAQLFGTVSSLSPSEEEPSLLLLGMLLLAACCLLLAACCLLVLVLVLVRVLVLLSCVVMAAVVCVCDTPELAAISPEIF